jgi:formylglycine-generating enzyme required for sulfatase activity
MGELDKKYLDDVPPDFKQYFGAPIVHAQIDKGLSLSKYEVTYDEFDYYIWTLHRAGHADLKYPTTAKGGRGARPVVYVSWNDANGFAEWLGKRRHQSCRLPTEAEWEYAARAGKQTAYPWGEKAGSNNGNCKDCGSQWDSDQSAPVGSFQPNGFGLYDTSGNVWEWTCSAWRNSFDGNEQRCVHKEDSVSRVLRGGSFNDVANVARSAARSNVGPDFRGNFLGLRVLCSSPIE